MIDFFEFIDNSYALEIFALLVLSIPHCKWHDKKIKNKSNLKKLLKSKIIKENKPVTISDLELWKK